MLFRSIHDEVPLLLVGDPLRLGQVLNSLMGNALKFTSQGQVHIEVAVQESMDGEVGLLFTVSDTGIGIEESQQGQLFDAFSQVDESISRQFGGTGLGLAISKRIVERCGGAIWLESVPGRGSAFHFTVRFKRQEQSDLPLKYKEIFTGSRVLVVDDNKMFRHFMAKMFTTFHLEVESAETGEDALEKLREMASLRALPHVILLDYFMPVMDGLTLAKILAEDVEFAGIPIVMITSEGQDVDLRRRAEEFGVKAVLTKPVKRELLFSCLEMILQGEVVGSGAGKIAGNHKEVLGGHRILLVEDNSISREVTSDLLANAGVEVITAEDGKEALAKVGAGVDAVLMNVQLPRLNGLEATCQIRQRPELAGLPIVAMTARAIEGDRQQCLDAGMSACIAKPIDPEILYQVLGEVLSRDGVRITTPEVADLADGDREFALPGITAAGALRRINNNRVLYRQLLGEFVRENQNVIADINSYLQAGEIGKVILIVHTLKSVAGNLGALALQDAAQAIERSLRQEASMPMDLMAGLENRLYEVLKGLETFRETGHENGMAGHARAASPLPEGKELQKIFITLLAYIEANTPRAEKFLQELPCYASSEFEERRQEILACLEQFDFEGARNLLFRLASQIGVELDGV